MGNPQYAARTNYFRAQASDLQQLLANHPTVELRTRNDDDGTTWYALVTGDPAYAERHEELMLLWRNLAMLLDDRDALAASFVGFDQDRLFGRTILLDRDGELGRVDLSDINRIAGDHGIALGGAED